MKNEKKVTTTTSNTPANTESQFPANILRPSRLSRKRIEKRQPRRGPRRNKQPRGQEAAGEMGVASRGLGGPRLRRSLPGAPRSFSANKDYQTAAIPQSGQRLRPPPTPLPPAVPSPSPPLVPLLSYFASPSSSSSLFVYGWQWEHNILISNTNFTDINIAAAVININIIIITGITFPTAVTTVFVIIVTNVILSLAVSGAGRGVEGEMSSQTKREDGANEGNVNLR